MIDTDRINKKDKGLTASLNKLEFLEADRNLGKTIGKGTDEGYSPRHLLEIKKYRHSYSWWLKSERELQYG